MNTVQAQRRIGAFSAADVVIAEHIAGVLTGGDADATRPFGEREMMTLERTALLDLARHAATRARIEHMLTTGKPLRN